MKSINNKHDTLHRRITVLVVLIVLTTLFGIAALIFRSATIILAASIVAWGFLIYGLFIGRAIKKD